MTNPLPGLPEFEYIKLDTIVNASRFLADHPNEAAPLLGGTDIFVRMRDRILTHKYLVDIKGLNDTNEIKFHPEDGLTIGAAVNMNEVVNSLEVSDHYPILAEACRSVASYQLRNRATIIGNICNASPAGDTIGACLLLGGILHVHGTDGSREELLHNFFIGPGKTVLKPGDIVTAISFPIPPEEISGRYIKLGRNQMSDLAIVGVTAVGYQNETLPSGYEIKLALASVAPTPLVVRDVEEYLSQNEITDEKIASAADIAYNACSPIDDVRGSARYRQIMVRNLSQKAIGDVCRQLGIDSLN